MEALRSWDGKNKRVRLHFDLTAEYAVGVYRWSKALAKWTLWETFWFPTKEKADQRFDELAKEDAWK